MPRARVTTVDSLKGCRTNLNDTPAGSRPMNSCTYASPTSSQFRLYKTGFTNEPLHNSTLHDDEHFDIDKGEEITLEMLHRLDQET